MDDLATVERRLRYAANDRDGHGLCRAIWANDAIEAADALATLRAERDKMREALEEAIEFADQDVQALTPAGEAMVGRWRAALAPPTP